MQMLRDKHDDQTEVSPTWSSAMGFFARNQNILSGNNNQLSANKQVQGDKRSLPVPQMAFHQTTTAHTNQVRPIFGQSIVDIDGERLLDFINRFIYEIDTRGLTSKGIYRVSSIKSKVDKLCNYFDQNPSNLIDLSSFHPNIIANALKMYLRRLPEPLLTLEIYPCLIEIAKKYSPNSQATSSSTIVGPLASHTKSKHASKGQTQVLAALQNYDPNVMIDEFRRVTRLLPAKNHEILATIMRHLRRVANMADKNQMGAKNLAIIFGPTLLSPANNKSLAIADNIHQARVIELMITWAYQIFPEIDCAISLSSAGGAITLAVPKANDALIGTATSNCDIACKLNVGGATV